MADTTKYSVKETVTLWQLSVVLLNDQYRIPNDGKDEHKAVHVNRGLLADWLQKNNKPDDFVFGPGYRKDSEISIPKIAAGDAKALLRFLTSPVGLKIKEKIVQKQIFALSNKLWKKDESSGKNNVELENTAFGDIVIKKSHGNAVTVEKIQNALMAYKILDTIDGVKGTFENTTENAIGVFQKKYMGIANPSKEVGSMTICAMDKALNEHWIVNLFVTFTFDDGPDASSTSVLLSKLPADVPVVFFVKGAGFKDWGYMKSCEIGIHYFDKHTTGLSRPEIDRQQKKSSASIAAAGFAVPRYYRSPTGERNEKIKGACHANGLKYVYWDIDSEDWYINSFSLTEDQKKTFIAMHILKGLLVGNKEYAVILMHDSRIVSVKTFIDYLKPILVDYDSAKLDELIRSFRKDDPTYTRVIKDLLKKHPKGWQRNHLNDLMKTVDYCKINADKMKTLFTTKIVKAVNLDKNNSKNIVTY